MEEAEALARASVKEQLGDALRSIAEDAAPPGRPRAHHRRQSPAACAQPTMSKPACWR